MAIRTAYKQSKYGEELVTLQGQGQRAADTFKTVRARLAALRSTIQGDTDLTQAERDAASAEVVSAINTLVTQIQSEAQALSGEWQVGLDVQVDEIYSYNGTDYRVVQAHTTQADWTPPDVPALFEPV